MYNIIAGVDESVPHGIDIAESITNIPLQNDQVHVTLLHDFEDNPEGASVDQVASVRRARDILQEADHTVKLEESSGKPARAILRLADKRDAELIVLSGRKRTPAGKVIFGSVTQSVILDTSRSVLVCGDEGD